MPYIDGYFFAVRLSGHAMEQVSTHRRTEGKMKVSLYAETPTEVQILWTSMMTIADPLIPSNLLCLVKGYGERPMSERGRSNARKTQGVWNGDERFIRGFTHSFYPLQYMPSSARLSRNTCRLCPIPLARLGGLTVVVGGRLSEIPWARLSRLRYCSLSLSPRRYHLHEPALCMGSSAASDGAGSQ